MRGASRRVIARTVALQLIQRPDQRRQIIDSLAAYLIQHRRLQEVDMLVNDIAREMFVQNGTLLANVQSTKELSDQIREDLKTLLSSQSGAKTVELFEDLNPYLKGGIVIRTADHVMDMSISTKLKQLSRIA